MSAMPPVATKIPHRREMTRWANALNRFAIDSRKVSLNRESGKQDIDCR